MPPLVLVSSLFQEKRKIVVLTVGHQAPCYRRKRSARCVLQPVERKRCHMQQFTIYRYTFFFTVVTVSLSFTFISFHIHLVLATGLFLSTWSQRER